ncbi:MAG: chromate efflux transporter [Acidimicrobiales bacterium]
MAAGAGRARSPLAEVASVFLKIGTIAFGGPAVHVAMMRDETVVRRHWVPEQDFVDALGVTSVLPGPGSTQMSMVLGRRRAGWPGLVVGGVCFILPAFAIVLALAWAYVHYGRSTVGTGLLYGIKPVVIAVVAQALWGLSRVAVRGVLAWVLAAAAFAAYFAGVYVLLVLLGAGIVMAAVREGPRLGRHGRLGAVLPWPLLAGTVSGHGRIRTGSVFVEFLKLGVVVFGSGYVLLAFLQRDLVHGLGWLGTSRLLDAVAVGQLTPGPVFTTATFIGYLVAGFPGAAVATLGIFLPSFVMVAAAAPFIERMRRAPLTAALLDGVNAAALGLMAAVAVDLGRSALHGVVPALVGAAAVVALVRFRVNSAWVVLAGAAIGVVHAFA